jgi:hypothetical protein
MEQVYLSLLLLLFDWYGFSSSCEALALQADRSLL